MRPKCEPYLNSHIKTLGFFVITSFIPTLLVLRWQKCALKTNLCISFVLTGLSKKFSDPTLNPSFAIDPGLLYVDALATAAAAAKNLRDADALATADAATDADAKNLRDAAEAAAIKYIKTNPLHPSCLIISENIAHAIRAVREGKRNASITAQKGDDSPKNTNAKEYLRKIIKKGGDLHQIISLYQSDRLQYGPEGATPAKNKGKAKQMAAILTNFCTRIQQELQ